MTRMARDSCPRGFAIRVLMGMIAPAGLRFRDRLSSGLTESIIVPSGGRGAKRTAGTACHPQVRSGSGGRRHGIREAGYGTKPTVVGQHREIGAAKEERCDLRPAGGPTEPHAVMMR